LLNVIADCRGLKLKLYTLNWDFRELAKLEFDGNFHAIIANLNVATLVFI
jgi:hypothetical protein